jgi:hypothetical protein
VIEQPQTQYAKSDGRHALKGVDGEWQLLAVQE